MTQDRESPGEPPIALLPELQAAIDDRGGSISFAEFMRLALYHPTAGYYRRPTKRIGFGGSTDFFTSTSTGDVFGTLVVEACQNLLAPEPPEEFCFVEIGAEPGRGVLPEKHPFTNNLLLRRDDRMEIPAKSVVFSNELFDAQPFHRLVFTDGSWRELGVGWEEGPAETLLPKLSPRVAAVVDRLPPDATEGYHLDLPLDAEDLLEEILTRSSWTGLLLLFDYGKSWRELLEATPQGTARAYHRHRQSNDLLAQPGEQDLTCHVCWDWLENIVKRHRFRDLALRSQEAFFVSSATSVIKAIVAERPGEFDPRRQTLHQLLHPGNMGQKFQVLHARR